MLILKLTLIGGTPWSAADPPVGFSGIASG
jgi:hypothetical protein